MPFWRERFRLLLRGVIERYLIPTQSKIAEDELYIIKDILRLVTLNRLKFMKIIKAMQEGLEYRI
jgi:hypothetical protein